MTKINSLNKQNVNYLRPHIEEALKELGNQFGLTLKLGNCRFSSETAQFKLDVTVNGANGEVITKEAADFKRNAKSFGFEPEDLGKFFTERGTQYFIVGLKRSSHRYPILGKRADGRLFKFPANLVLNALGRTTRMPGSIAEILENMGARNSL